MNDVVMRKFWYLGGVKLWSVMTNSPSSTNMIVTILLHRAQPINQKFIVSLEQHNTGGNGRQEHVIYNNQTKIETTFTMLS